MHEGKLEHRIKLINRLDKLKVVKKMLLKEIEELENKIKELYK